MKFKYGDFIIFFFVAALAVGALLLGMGPKLANGSLSAEIYQDGRLVRTVNLSALSSPVEFELSGQFHEKIIAEKGRIRFAEADCPDKTCVHTGWLAQPGQSAACLPNRVLIKITGGQADTDVVVR